MVHLSYKWEGDKIIEEYHFSDGAAFDKEVEHNTSLENENYNCILKCCLISLFQRNHFLLFTFFY